MCSTGPFQFRWLKGYIYSSCYYHHQIGSINLTHCYHIFRGCVPEMFVAPYSVTYCIYIPGKPVVCFHYYYAVYDDLKELYVSIFVCRKGSHWISLSCSCWPFWQYMPNSDCTALLVDKGRKLIDCTVVYFYFQLFIEPHTSQSYPRCMQMQTHNALASAPASNTNTNHRCTQVHPWPDISWQVEKHIPSNLWYMAIKLLISQM